MLVELVHHFMWFYQIRCWNMEFKLIYDSLRRLASALNEALKKTASMSEALAKGQFTMSQPFLVLMQLDLGILHAKTLTLCAKINNVAMTTCIICMQLCYTSTNTTFTS